MAFWKPAHWFLLVAKSEAPDRLFIAKSNEIHNKHSSKMGFIPIHSKAPIIPTAMT